MKLESRKGFTFVYGENLEQFEHTFIQTYPKYQLQINPIFSNDIQIGPFKVKNKKSMFDILLKHTKMSNEKLYEQLRKIDILDIASRIPYVLSKPQLLIYSLFYEVIQGRSKALMHLEQKINFEKLINWLESKSYFESFILICPVSEKEIVEMMYEYGCLYDDHTHFCKIENGHMIDQDKDLLAKKYDIEDLLITEIEYEEILGFATVWSDKEIKASKFINSRTKKIITRTKIDKEEIGYSIYFPIDSKSELKQGDYLYTITSK